MADIRLVLLGPPGSGKGTQAKLLAQHQGLAHVSTGDLLRKNISEKTELGKAAEEVMAAGRLVRTRLIFDMLLELYKEDQEHKDLFVLDGFPRSVKQAEGLSNFLEEQGRPLTHVLQLNLADDAIVERLVHRRTCPVCGRTYHLLSAPPKVENRCDDDGAELIWRPDDHEDVIRNRLLTYHEQTEPVVKFYAEKGLLQEIDASQNLQEIQAQITRLILN